MKAKKENLCSNPPEEWPFLSVPDRLSPAMLPRRSLALDERKRSTSPLSSWSERLRKSRRISITSNISYFFLFLCLQQFTFFYLTIFYPAVKSRGRDMKTKFSSGRIFEDVSYSSARTLSTQSLGMPCTRRPNW